MAAHPKRKHSHMRKGKRLRARDYVIPALDRISHIMKHQRKFESFKKPDGVTQETSPEESKDKKQNLKTKKGIKA